MEGFYLLCAHLLGDYILQNDWMAANKAKPFFAGWRNGLNGDLACTVHCALYTLSVWAFSWWWMPWWGLAACFLTHWVMDRCGLAGKWMRHVSGQKSFAEKMSPWSVIVVDNSIHLLTLAGIAALAGRV